MSITLVREPSPILARYRQACENGILLYQHCSSCKEPVFHPRHACPYCLEDALSWEESSGHGTIYSWSVQHVHLSGKTSESKQRVFGIIAMDEGFHMFSEILIPPTENPSIGMKVAVVFERGADDVILPKFRRLP